MANTIRLLHTEDDGPFAELVETFLHRELADVTVHHAVNPVEGVEILADSPIDCIVSDYDMPQINGIEFLESVRDDHPELPFILFTGKGSEEVAGEAISAGVTDYLQKEGGTGQFTVLANRIKNAVERHQALQQIDLSHRALETANEGISLVEPDGTFSYVNSAFGQLFGYDPEELTGEQWTVLYHNEEAQRLENDILPAVAEQGYWSGETVRLTKDGKRLVTDHRLANTDGDAIVCTAQDVTPERVEMTNLDDTFGLLFDSLEGQAFYTLDHEGYITRWNEGAKRLKGYEASEILGEHISVFHREEDRKAGVPEALIETAKKDESVEVSGWRLRKDGTQFWADVTLSANYDKSGTLRGFGKVTRESAQAVEAQ